MLKGVSEGRSDLVEPQLMPVALAMHLSPGPEKYLVYPQLHCKTGKKIPTRPCKIQLQFLSFMYNETTE
jgi:hypothetical protein